MQNPAASGVLQGGLLLAIILILALAGAIVLQAIRIVIG